MQLKKLMASLGLLVCVCTNFNAVAYAETTAPFIDDGISLAYEIANDSFSDLSIVSKTAYCTSRTNGKDAISITVTQTLQKKSLLTWKSVDGAEWTKTVNSSSINFSNSKSDLDSGTYRVKSVFTLSDKNGKSETITIYSGESKVP